jgi:hypothetical protein
MKTFLLYFTLTIGLLIAAVGALLSLFYSAFVIVFIAVTGLILTGVGALIVSVVVLVSLAYDKCVKLKKKYQGKTK